MSELIAEMPATPTKTGRIRARLGAALQPIAIVARGTVRPGWRGLGRWVLLSTALFAAGFVVLLGIYLPIRFFLTSTATNFVFAAVQLPVGLYFLLVYFRLSLATVRGEPVRPVALLPGWRLFGNFVLCLGLVLATAYLVMLGTSIVAVLTRWETGMRVFSLVVQASLIAALFYTAFAPALIADGRAGLLNSFPRSVRIVRGQEKALATVILAIALVLTLFSVLHPTLLFLALPPAPLVIAALYDECSRHGMIKPAGQDEIPE